MEVTYVADLIKKKAPTYASKSMLTEVISKAKVTIDRLSRDLITMDLTNEKIFELY
jgi:hypothetical protein